MKGISWGEFIVMTADPPITAAAATLLLTTLEAAFTTGLKTLPIVLNTPPIPVGRD